MTAIMADLVEVVAEQRQTCPPTPLNFSTKAAIF